MPSSRRNSITYHVGTRDDLVGLVPHLQMEDSETGVDTHIVPGIDFGSIAICNNQMIGMFSFLRKGKNTLSAAGTVVRTPWRQLGIGKQLWINAIEHMKPEGIKVQVATDYGYTLVLSVKRLYPHLKWTIIHGDDEPPYDLRKAS